MEIPEMRQAYRHAFNRMPLVWCKIERRVIKEVITACLRFAVAQPNAFGTSQTCEAVAGEES